MFKSCVPVLLVATALSEYIQQNILSANATQTSACSFSELPLQKWLYTLHGCHMWE